MVHRTDNNLNKTIGQGWVYHQADLKQNWSLNFSLDLNVLIRGINIPTGPTDLMLIESNKEGCKPIQLEFNDHW